MELRFRVTRRRVALLAAALAAAATGSIGWAAVGDGGTIQGCVTNNGTIDAIDPITQACRDRQTPVEWYTKAGADAAFLGVNAKATDADKLDGLDSTSFLGANAKAADAGALDGIDSTGFVQGTGNYVRRYEISVPFGTRIQLLGFFTHASLIGICREDTLVQFELTDGVIGGSPPFTVGGFDGVVVSSASVGFEVTPVVTQRRAITANTVQSTVGQTLKADFFGTFQIGAGTVDLTATGTVLGTGCRMTASGTVGRG